MAGKRWFSGCAVAIAFAGVLCAQAQQPPTQQQPRPQQPPVQPLPEMRVPPGFFPRPFPPEAQNPRANPSTQQQPGAPGAQQPGAPGQPPAATTPAAPQGPPTVYGGLSLTNASLVEVIDMLARQLKLNYILDPRVKGSIMLNTFGETKDIDMRSLLELILRVNGFGMVKQGDLYRIVPLADISRLPLPPETNVKDIPEDDRTMLNLVFLKYVTVDELSKVLEPFIGEGARMFSYAPANLLLLLDSRRNMRRTMELISLFDSDTLANQRVRVFEVKYGRPSDLSKELDSIAKSISLSEKGSPIKFLPIDRINTIIAVSPNPGSFAEVEKWLAKLDVPVKATAGAVSNYVYRVRYGDAQSIGCSIQALFGQLSGFGGVGSSISFCVGMAGGQFGGMGGGGGFGGMNGGMNGMNGGMYGGMNGGMYGGGGMYPGGMPYAQGMYSQGPGLLTATNPFGPPVAPQTQTGSAPGAATGGTDLTGNYLGVAGGTGSNQRVPRVVANPFNNTLLIQATPQEYDSILSLLKDLDVPPRQVLIEAKIYSVDLSHAFSSDVQAKLQQVSGSGTPHTFLGSFGNGSVNLSSASLVGMSRELLAAVQLQESENRAKVLSAPSVIATDSIPASINVGTQVPTLTAQAVTGIQQGGNSLFANSVSNQNSGVTLNIIARVTPSGVVTMIINQDVSSPIAPTSGGIQSPSFDKKSIQTQITVQDGDTVAIGGIIDEKSTVGSSGIPVLHRIPLIGSAFGFRTYSKERTELIIFITPRVIYDSNQMSDATDELKGRVKLMRKLIKE
ncbi:MAG TPA: type II secretion system secretin GspD [Bryobacteraceae bacterium]|nr:type II secretion system secretin GspD [Bryobacteraceae bacterium]